jgi:hypothetical protein
VTKPNLPPIDFRSDGMYTAEGWVSYDSLERVAICIHEGGCTPEEARKIAADEEHERACRRMGHGRG